jgi:hypothetical protein
MFGIYGTILLFINSVPWPGRLTLSSTTYKRFNLVNQDYFLLYVIIYIMNYKNLETKDFNSEG